MTVESDAVIIDTLRWAAFVNRLTPAERLGFFAGMPPPYGPAHLRELIVERTRRAFDPVDVAAKPWLAEIAPVIERALDALDDAAFAVMLDAQGDVVDWIWAHRDGGPAPVRPPPHRVVATPAQPKARRKRNRSKR